MPPLELAPGAYYAKCGSDEHKELEKRAYEGEFTIETVSGSDDEIFVPERLDQSMAVAAYTMETGSLYAVIANTRFVPGVEPPNRQTDENISLPEKRVGPLSRILGKVGLGRE